MNQRAQVSLEYILITLSIVVILSLIIIQAGFLYSKNITQIDNRNLKDAYEKIQSNLDIVELLEYYYEEITVYPKSTWYFEKLNNNTYKLYNKHKEYSLNFNQKINLNINNIKNESIIIIKKENKVVYVEIK